MAPAEHKVNDMRENVGNRQGKMRGNTHRKGEKTQQFDLSREREREGKENKSWGRKTCLLGHDYN